MSVIDLHNILQSLYGSGLLVYILFFTLFRLLIHRTTEIPKQRILLLTHLSLFAKDDVNSDTVQYFTPRGEEFSH